MICTDCLKLSELLVALQDKISWGELKLIAPHLSSHDLLPLLTDIERDYQGRERFVHALRAWLDRDCGASWEKVVSALRVISKNVLALEIEKKHCTEVKSPPRPSGKSPDFFEPPALEQASPPPRQLQDKKTSDSTAPSPATTSTASSVPPTDHSATGSLEVASSRSCAHDSGLQEVTDEAAHLQEQFVSVLINTKVCFMAREKKTKNFLTKFKVTLTTLPLSKRHQHLFFLRKEKKQIMKAEDIDGIFDILDPYWNYVDYAFLEYIIKVFGTSELKEEIEKYIAELEIFEKKTSVYDFDLAVADKRNFPTHLKMVTITQAKDPKNCSLYEVRQFKNAIINRSTLNDYAVFLKGVSCSSIKITLAVPPEAYNTVYETLDEQFMSEHRIVYKQFIGLTTTKIHTSVVRRQETRRTLQCSASRETREGRHGSVSRRVRTTRPYSNRINFTRIMNLSPSSRSVRLTLSASAVPYPIPSPMTVRSPPSHSTDPTQAVREGMRDIWDPPSHSTDQTQTAREGMRDIWETETVMDYDGLPSRSTDQTQAAREGMRDIWDPPSHSTDQTQTSIIHSTQQTTQQTLDTVPQLPTLDTVPQLPTLDTVPQLPTLDTHQPTTVDTARSAPQPPIHHYAQHDTEPDTDYDTSTERSEDQESGSSDSQRSDH